jgi:hypothetical protein
VCVSIEHAMVANVEQQHQEFGNIIFKPAEAVEDFALHINKLAS